MTDRREFLLAQFFTAVYAKIKQRFYLLSVGRIGDRTRRLHSFGHTSVQLHRERGLSFVQRSLVCCRYA